MTRAAISRARQRGFTLIEVIIGLALLSLMMVLLGDTLGLGLKGLTRVEATADRLEGRRVLEAALRGQLEAAYGGGGRRDRRVEFDGAAATLSFATLASGGLDGFFKVELKIEQADGDRRLVMSRRVALGSGLDPAMPAQRTVLAHGVRGFSLAYFGTLPPDDAPRWHERWAEGPALPELIRVRLSLREDGRQSWPDLIARPRVRLAGR